MLLRLALVAALVTGCAHRRQTIGTGIFTSALGTGAILTGLPESRPTIDPARDLRFGFGIAAAAVGLALIVVGVASDSHDL